MAEVTAEKKLAEIRRSVSLGEEGSGDLAKEDRAWLLAHVTAQSTEIARLKADLEHGEECEECDRPINEGKGTFTICGRCWNAAQEKHVAEVARLKGEVERRNKLLKAAMYTLGSYKHGISSDVVEEVISAIAALFTAEGIETK